MNRFAKIALITATAATLGASGSTWRSFSCSSFWTWS